MSSLKERKRYIVYNIISKQDLPENRVKEVLQKSIKYTLGELGYAKAGIMLLDYSKNKGIIRVNNRYTEELKSSLLFINKINYEECIVSSSFASGILNKAKAKLA